MNAQHIHSQGKSKSLGHCQEHPVKGTKKCHRHLSRGV